LEVLDELDNGVAIVDDDGVTIAWNQALERITGLSTQEVLGTKWWEVQYLLTPEAERSPKLIDRLKARVVEVQVKGNGEWLDQVIDTEYIGSFGMRRFIHINIFHIKTENGRLLGMVVNDVTGRKLAEVAEQATRQMSEERALVIHEALEREQHLHKVTRFLTSRLEIDHVLHNVIRLVAELVDADLGDLGLISTDGEQLVYPYIYNVSAKTVTASLTHVKPKDTGMAWQVVESKQPILVQNAEKDPEANQAIIERGVHSLIMAPIMAGEKCLGVMGLFSLTRDKQFTNRDLAVIESVGRQAGIALQNAVLFEEVQKLAITDPLTGLFNRRHFFELSQRDYERALRYKRPLSVIMLDIDHFKQVNDTYGHAAGDVVLQGVAEHLSTSLRNTDIIGRYGGEEFVVLMPETNGLNASLVAERLRLITENTPTPTAAGPVMICISLGVASFDYATPSSFDELLLQADKALYAAKRAGRNQVKTWKEVAAEGSSTI
jgi:diguanylate cyclase (GGDEF)-like protein/PAS domain S-box-containing protein